MVNEDELQKGDTLTGQTLGVLNDRGILWWIRPECFEKVETTQRGWEVP